MNRLAFALAWRRALRALKTFSFIVVGFLLGVALLPSLLSRERPRLIVHSLGYNEDTGMVEQRVAPNDFPEITATWSALIRPAGSGGVVNTCQGSGVGVYEPSITGKAMTPNDWTGDECNLVPGKKYRGEATWSWTGPCTDDPETGRRMCQRREVGGSFDFTYRPGPAATPTKAD